MKQEGRLLSRKSIGSNAGRFVLRMNLLFMALFVCTLVSAQTAKSSVSGIVTDASGVTLPGVTVAVKGTSVGTISDYDGNYSLDLSKATTPNPVLVFSYIGYLAQEVTVNGKTEINVVLAEDAQKLDEVVITALGIKRQRRSLGYSTANVSGDQFTESRDANLGNALSGKIAGVSVANNSTGLGGSSRVIIRGNASLTGNNQPLYVVDGVPFDNSNQGNAGQWGGMDMGDGLSNINADDIEDIQVLKGAAASALYGYRGGNGVILITTKSGKSDQGLGIEFNNNLTFNNIYDYRDFQNVYGQGTQGGKPQTQQAAYETYSSSWGSKMDGSTAVNRLGDNYAYSGVDNWKNFYRTGISNQTSVAVSGSDKKVNYRFGLSNTFDQSILPNASANQQGINMNTTYKITPKLQLMANANYVFEHVSGRSNLSDGNGNVNATLLYLANSYDVRWLKAGIDGDGNELQPGNNVYFNNPYFLQYHKSNESDKNRLTGGLTLRYDVTDWLYAQGQVTRDGYILTFKQVQPNGAAADPNGYINEYEKNYSEINLNYLIGFNKKISDFSLAATVGGNRQRNIAKTYGTDGGIRPFLIGGFYSTSNVAAATRTFRKIYSEYQVNSVYGTADFSYKDWLYLNLTGRNDWFSTLNPDSNSYFYPSVSVSYMFSDCFTMPSWLSSGKLRASYASASNGTIPYQTALAYTTANFAVQEQSMGTVKNSVVPNAYLKPVRIAEWEAGTNIQLFNNRLGFDFAVYKKTTTDDIAQVTTSSASGYTSAIQNVGEIRNTGIELLLYGVPVKTKDFIWNTSLNLANNRSKVIFLGGAEYLSIDGATSNGGGATIRNIVGKSYGQIVGYKYKVDGQGNRVFNSEGLPIRTDQLEDLGNGVFKLTGGFRNDFTYKNIMLAFLIDFKFGAKLYSGTNYNLYSTGLHKNTLEGRDGGIIGKGVNESGAANTVSVDAQTYWRHITNQSITEEFVYDASFVKLREFSLGYQFPSSFLAKTPIRSLGISLVGRNLWTIIKHTPNIDPESAYNNTNGQGLELNGYPATRNIGFNLNVKF
ncbi:SusC/RagA family TonB-linked outer membrane protein [Dysgonomonas sp. ZJ279]|uniref:SusC/RagA family TonB-linked outer membrane protein n=1 Tax=Dysgonomonas sp. ZJ279 TaxID=2709796 RepID=UPI0021066425|nr:SusC/RagA family TonB-linked outer membrane protein [Dysgonomonas sp. ZJ279]